jgi:membrane protease YdiL (CAAX protease family)
VTAAKGPGGSTGGRPPGWKQGLALVSLALSLLLWLNGLVGSLNRPSVGGDLNLRQLELGLLAEPQLPAPLRPLLAGADPGAALDQALAEPINAGAEAGTPAAAELRLERALLLQRLGRGVEAEPLLRQLAAETNPAGQGPGPEARLAARLLAGNGDAAAARWPGQRPLLRLWSCEALGGGPRCDAATAGQRAVLQLLAVTLLPALVLILGVGLLLRELWLRWRGRAAALLPLQGPPLTGLDAVLLIAGGFVVIGELLTPLLVAPLLTALLQALAIASPLREGLSVVALYLALMAGPLLILALMLRGLGSAPEGGWLLLRWRPLGSGLQRALRTLLMVLPLVTLVGWLQGQIWGDPGGSNPLLDLVLRSQDPAALACFGFTAVVLAPLFEETIFRGVLLPVAGRELGPAWGVVLSAAVFAVAHLSLGELPPLFMLGLGLGWLRWSSGRLGCCVLMHALWNGLTFSNLLILGS